MAERRMFAKTIIDSDAFLDMPLTTQALYFHLSMRADDEGFINNPRKISRMIGCSDDDLRLLLAKKFILAFDSGVIVIKHWKIHNYIRNDRFKETVYKDERLSLDIKDNGAYTIRQPGDNHASTIGIPSDNHASYQMETQDSIGKYSVVEASTEIVKDNINNSLFLDSAETFQKSPENVENSVERTTLESHMSSEWHEQMADRLEKLGMKQGAAFHREDAARLRRQGK